MKSKKIVVFDFDGVVCDSTDECMVTSWNAWEIWEGRKAFRNSVNAFNNDEKLSFRRLRPYVRGAGEYYTLYRSLKECIKLNNQADFEKYANEWHEHSLQFKNIFFDCRIQLRSQDMVSWIKLHPVYNAVIEIMKQINQENRLYIATLKDGESVKLILEYYGISLNPNQLLDQSQIKSKKTALDIIKQRENCPISNMLFFDDNLTHLVDPQKAGYFVYLTNWGNTLVEFLETAYLYNVKVASIVELKELVD